MILDAGVLIAVDRGSESAREFLTTSQRLDEPLHTTAAVAAQVWRDGSRQARLARALQAMTVHPFLAEDVSPVGDALRTSGTSDVVDAHLFVVAQRLAHSIVTADVSDFMALCDTGRGAAPRILEWP